MLKDYITWNGQKWKLHKNGYYMRSAKKTLHREKWKALRGPIPRGFHVHHKNHVTTDNRIQNLECLSPAEHNRRHKLGHKWSDEQKAKRVAWWANNREEAVATVRGMHAARPKVTLSCVICGKKMRTIEPSKKFCSSGCRVKERRLNQKNLEDRACDYCGTSFRIYKHEKQKNCSHACGSKAMWQKRKAKLSP